MKLSLPATFSDITIKGMMTIRTQEDATEWLSVCGNVSREYVKRMPLHLFERAKAHLVEAIELEEPNHPTKIKVDGVEYGFIPDWSAFTTGEWIDIEMWAEDFWANADRIMALLYRPVKRKWGKRYEIAAYTAKEDRETFHGVSASYFAGAMLFFCNSRNRLLRDLQVSLTTVVEESMNSVESGDGMTTSTRSQGVTLPKWMRSRRSRLKLFSNTLPISKTYTQ